MRSVLYFLKYFVYGFATSVFLVFAFDAVQVRRSTLASSNHLTGGVEELGQSLESSKRWDGGKEKKKLAFVGIMTTAQFLTTRAVAGLSTFIDDGFEANGFDYAYFVPEGATREMENITTKVGEVSLIFVRIPSTWPTSHDEKKKNKGFLTSLVHNLRLTFSNPKSVKNPRTHLHHSYGFPKEKRITR